MELRLLPGLFGIVRTNPADPLPDWLHGKENIPLVSITTTALERSIVCQQEWIPDGWTAEIGWRALQVQGSLHFNLVGVLASLAQPLAAAGISIFVISTYDTDYFLVKEDRLSDAISALQQSGHSVS